MTPSKGASRRVAPPLKSICKKQKQGTIRRFLAPSRNNDVRLAQTPRMAVAPRRFPPPCRACAKHCLLCYFQEKETPVLFPRRTGKDASWSSGVRKLERLAVRDSAQREPRRLTSYQTVRKEPGQSELGRPPVATCIALRVEAACRHCPMHMLQASKDPAPSAFATPAAVEPVTAAIAAASPAGKVGRDLRLWRRAVKMHTAVAVVDKGCLMLGLGLLACRRRHLRRICHQLYSGL